MNGFVKAFILFSGGSLIATATQIIKGKFSAIFLGVGGVGTFNQLTNAWSLLFTLAGLGFYSGIVRKLSISYTENHSERLKREFITPFIFLTIFSFLITSIAIFKSDIISIFLFNDAGKKAWLVAATLWSVPLAIMSQLYVGLFNACRMIRSVVGVQIATDLIGTVLFVFFIFWDQLWGAVLSFGLMHVVKIVIQIQMVRSCQNILTLHHFPIRFNSVELNSHWKYGISALLMVSAGILTMTIISRWIIQSFGEEANGLFSVAWKVASLYFGALCASASGYYFPALSSAQDQLTMKNQILEALSLYMYLMAPLSLILVMGAGDLMRLLFSRDFVSAASFLVWFLPADILRISSETIGLSFLAKKKITIYTASYILWVINFLSLSRLLMNKYGVIGVGYAYFISHLIGLVIIMICTKRVLGISFSIKSLRPLIFAFGVLAVAVYVVSIGLATWQQYLIGGLIACFWFGISWRDEIFRGLMQTGKQKIKEKLRWIC